VMNSAHAIERSVDKAWTSALLEQAGLPTPDTVVCERSEDAFVALREMGDVVVKPLFGSMGLGMMRVSEEDTAFRVFRAIEMTRGVFYLQRFIPHQGADIRAFVVGDQVIGAIFRSAPGWKTNVSRGGTARPCTIDPVLERRSPRWRVAARCLETTLVSIEKRTSLLSLSTVSPTPRPARPSHDGWQAKDETSNVLGRRDRCKNADPAEMILLASYFRVTPSVTELD